MPGTQSIDGLVSSLDTTSIIDSIIQAERQQAVLMEERQAELTQEISTFNALSAKLLALQSSVSILNDEKAFSQASISISNEDLLSATAESALSTGTYSLNILSLAQNHQIASQGFDDPLSAVMGTGTISLSMGDRSLTTITIDEGNNSLIGIKNAINDAKAGVTASIINDGSDSGAYRLVLTGNDTGRNNQISISAELTGGYTLDYETASFDNPEIINFSSQATARVSLGATADYTGATNAVYTFTVGGTGVQTVGQGNIVLNWTDGTDSGSLVVSQSDTEIIGPDGLKLTLSDGDLVAGDTFQVSTFAPVLQQAADARVSIGSSADGASPIVIRSATNTVEDIIPGLTIDLKGVTTEATGPVTIKTGLNTDGIKENIMSVINAYNDVMDFIDEQNEYDSDTQESGVLMGDLTLMTIQTRVSGMIGRPVTGLDSSINTLASIGIRTGTSGRLSLRDPGMLEEALNNDFEAVLRLFVDGGTSTNTGISFLNASSEIEPGGIFDVDITQVATHGYFQGGTIADPADSPLTLDDSHNKIKFRVDGVLSEEIILDKRTYASGEDLANELQTKIDADDKIGNRGVGVEWVDLGNTGYLKLTSSTYGSSSKVELVTSITDSAFSLLGLTAGEVAFGQDVAGTINGESATGKGQILTGDEGNATTDGLQLKITLTRSQLVSASEGSITVTRGVASMMKETLDSITKSSDGVIARKTGGLQRQIDDYKQQIEDFDERLALRRERLYEQFTALETALSEFQTESAYLESQLAGIQSNFNQILGNG